MERTTDFNTFNFDGSIDVLAQYATHEEGQKIALRANSIVLLRVQDVTDPRPGSDLQSALERIVKEANDRILAGTLPENTPTQLKEGLLLLGKELKNEDITRLSKEILTSDGFTLVERDEIEIALPASLFSASRVMGVATRGFNALQRYVGLAPLAPVGPQFPILDLMSDIRKYHVFKFLDVEDLLSLKRTAKPFLQDVKSSFVSECRLLIAMALKQFGGNADILYRVAKLIALLGDKDGSTRTMAQASGVLDKTEKEGFLCQRFAEDTKSKIENNDLEGAKKSLEEALVKVNKLNPQYENAKMRTLQLIAECQIALGLGSEAKKTLTEEHEKLNSSIETAEMLISLKEFEEANRVLKKAQVKAEKMAPSPAITDLLKIEKLHFSMRNDSLANDAFEKAIDTALTRIEGDANILYSLINIAKKQFDLKKMSNLQTTFNAIKELLLKHPKLSGWEVELVMKYARLLIKADQRNEAEERISQVKAALSEYADYKNSVLMLMGSCFADLGKMDEMKEAFATIFESEQDFPDEINYLKNIALEYARVGNHEEAKKLLTQAKERVGLKERPERYRSPDWGRRLLLDVAKVQIEISDFDGAKDTLALAAKIPPEEQTTEKNAHTQRTIIENQLALHGIDGATLSANLIQDKEEKCFALLDIAIAKAKIPLALPG